MKKFIKVRSKRPYGQPEKPSKEWLAAQEKEYKKQTRKISGREK